MLKQIVTRPEIEPITLEEAKDHLVIQHHEDDTLIVDYIRAARRHIEQRCNRVFVRQKWRLWLDYGFSAFDLAPAVVREVESVNYLDTDGASQVLASSVYTVDIPRQQIYLAYNQSWPGTRSVQNAIWVDVWAGEYQTGTSPIDIRLDIPEDIRLAMLMLVADFYENRGRHSEITLNVNASFDALIQPWIFYENR